MYFSCLNQAVLAILLILNISSSNQLPAGTFDEDVTSPPKTSSAADLKITIADVEASLSPIRQSQEFTLRTIIAVNVENVSDSELTLAREQFTLLIDGEPAEIGSVDAHPSLQRTILQPGKSAEGWIGFGSIEYTGAEPSMVLRWQPSTANANEFEILNINLNQELRTQSDFRQTRLGPEGCLLQITTNRRLDVLSIWPAEQILKAAAAEKIHRILFSSGQKTAPVLHEEFNVWLSGMIETSASPNDLNVRFLPRMNPPFPRPEIRFSHITVGGMSEAANRQFGIYLRPVVVLRSDEAAVASALTPVYRHVAIDLAVADLKHSEPGVRRAAMAGAVDRLKPDQASSVIDDALHGSPELQIEMAGYLNLIPGEKSIDALRILSLSDNPQVAVAALRSLIESLNPATEDVMKDLWQTGKSNAILQSQILSVIIRHNSERWTPLVADYAAEKIAAAASRSVPVESVEDDPAALAESEYDEPIDSFVPAESNSRAQPNLLGRSLTFLRQQQHAGTLETLRRYLLELPDPGLQDIALSALVEARDPADEAIIRECLDRRIRSEKISDSVRAAAVQLPSPQWTEMFLADLTSEIDANHQSLSANALLRCASATQLDGIIDNFESLPDIGKQHTLRYLVTLDHPRWKSLAKKLLDAPLSQSSERTTSHRTNARSIATDTIQLLAADASEESITMLTDRLEQAIEEVGAADDIPLETRLYVHRLIESISMITHPECRRSLNRAARCNNQDLKEKTGKQLFDAMQRSPAGIMLIDRIRNSPDNGPKLEDNEETVEFFDHCIEADPFLTEIYIRRSSVLMHLNRFEETMRDLKTASRLSPENMDVESMIGLCQIRQGETEAGLKYAEELIVMAPRDLSSLYNGACSYSRALENSNVAEEQKQLYADRAIQLLQLSIAAGFYEFDHLQNDEDLVALHSHPDWSQVVESAKKMHEEKLRKQQ
jgi:tetratricopeptide (TPR) repeat protein